MNALVRKNPQSSFLVDPESVFSQFDSIFRDRFSDILDGTTPSLSLFERATYPRLDIRDESDKVVVEVEVPGLSKEDVKVELNENVLIVRGEKKKDVKEEKGNYIRRELKRSSFSRQVCRLNDNCDVEKIDASFKNGILIVTIPKKKVEQTTPQIKQIPVN